MKTLSNKFKKCTAAEIAASAAARAADIPATAATTAATEATRAADIAAASAATIISPLSHPGLFYLFFVTPFKTCQIRVGMCGIRIGIGNGIKFPKRPVLNKNTNALCER